MDGSSPDSSELIRADVEAKTIRLSFALNAGIEDIEETFENGYVPDQYKTPLNISRAAARIITNFELKSTDRVSTRPISCYFHARMTALLQNSQKSAFSKSNIQGPVGDRRSEFDEVKILRFWSSIVRGFGLSLSVFTGSGPDFLVDTLSISKCFHDLTPQIFYRFSFIGKDVSKNPKMVQFIYFNSRFDSTNKLCSKISVFYEKKLSIFGVRNCEKAQWIRNLRTRAKDLPQSSRSSVGTKWPKMAQTSSKMTNIVETGFPWIRFKKSHNG